MSIVMINGELPFGIIRYFQSDRCINTIKLQEFNQGKIKAKELVTFDCGLMDLKEIEESAIQIPEKNRQLLAVIVCPETEPNEILRRENRFEFCGYDLVDMTTCISAITNCGAEFEEAIDYHVLNHNALIPSYRQAVHVQLDLQEKYPDDPHACCEIVEIWRWLL